jgi:hypothetical protein
MGPWPGLYQVTIISDGRLGDAAHTDRRITLKARSRLKNGSSRVGEHPTSILAVENACSVRNGNSGSLRAGSGLLVIRELGRTTRRDVTSASHRTEQY